MINDYYKNLPKKRMGAGVLVFNQENKLLIVKPSYKDHWSIPGGVVEQDESPKNACIREIKEEIGIELKEIGFVCVDYVKGNEEKDENLQFIFHYPKLNPEQENRIKVDGKEISEFRFVESKEAIKLFGGLNTKMAKRVAKCIDAINKDKPIYLENEENLYAK